MRGLAVLAALMTAAPVHAQGTLEVRDKQRFGAWKYGTVTDPATDAPRGIAATTTPGPIEVVVKCDRGGDNQLYVQFDAQATLGSSRGHRYRSVAYRLDGSPRRDISAFYEERSALLTEVVPGNEAARFLKDLAGSSELTVQLTTVELGQVTAVLDVRGAGAAFAKVADTCKDASMGNYLR